MPETQQNIYSTDDAGLFDLLKGLFDEGHDEVIVQHPTEGQRVITREQYIDMYPELKLAKLPPGKRVVEQARIERLKRKEQALFVFSMKSAEAITIDPDSDQGITDVDGNEIDISDMEFCPIHNYPKGITVLDNELGAMVHPEQTKGPIRLIQNDLCR